MKRRADNSDSSAIIGTRFELKPIDFQADSDLCIQFRADSFVCSFGNSQAFWGEDNNGAERYVRWLQGKSNEIVGSCAHLWDGSRIVGQIELGRLRDPMDCGYIYVIYLVPEYRQQGLGTRLLQHAEALFRTWGTSEGLLRVSPSNTAAFALYDKNGWCQTSPEPDAEGLISMKKRW